jgi:hypothetical protein
MIEIFNDVFYPDWQEENIEISQRLITAYKNTINQNPSLLNSLNLVDDLWSIIIEHPHIFKLRELLDSSDVKNLSIYLNDFGREHIWYGGIHTSGLDPVTPFPLGYDYTFKEMQRLSLSIGLDIYSNDNVDDIVIRLSNYFGFNIIPLPVIPVAGLKSSYGILNERHINSLYLANLIKKYTTVNANISEYGGGLGLNAYYLSNMGRQNVHLFDLPFVNVLSGYFLIKSLGKDAVVLEGEESRQNAIHIKAFWNCNSYPENYFEVTVNQDSFPEINVDLLKKYFNIIERNTRSYFFSINQEHEGKYADGKKHNSVPKIISWFSNFQSILRKPYGLRTEIGYIEEHYKIVKESIL